MIMKNIPVTYLVSQFPQPEKVRRSILHELAVNGVRNIVLGDAMISEIVRNPAFAQTLQKEAAAEGLNFMDSHAPFGKALDMNNPDAGGIVSTAQKLHLHIAAMFGIKTMTIHVGNNYYFQDASLEVQRDRICRRLEKLLPVAEELGIIICIENVWFKINTPEQLLFIKEHFPSDNLGFCFDSGHANIMQHGHKFPEGIARTSWDKDNSGEPSWDDRVLEKMLPYIVNCHLHDNDGITDYHTIPGRGNVDWKNILPMLLKAPRLQVLQSEVQMFRNGLSIKETVESFEHVFSELEIEK